jgi:PAS domain S-box-containing protein
MDNFAMQIDFRTLVVVVGLTFFTQAVALFFQRLLNKTYHGLGWWTLSYATTALAFVLLILRDVPSLEHIAIVTANTLIELGIIFIHIGCMRFLGKKENRWLLIALLAVYIPSFIFFTYAQNDIAARIAIASAGLTVVQAVTALAFFSNKIRAIRASTIFNGLVFLGYGCFFAVRLLLGLTASQADSFFNPAMLQAMVILAQLIFGNLSAIGLIVMVNQRTNAESREAQKNAELIFNTSPDAASITRLSDGQYISINDGFSRLTGYTRAEVIGKTSLNLNLWKNPADRQAFVSALDKTGTCENLEAVFQRKDGIQLIGLMSARLVSLQGETHISCMIHDISERKRGEDALQASRRQLTDIIEFLPDATLAIDTQGCVIIWNKAIEKMTGIPASEMIGKCGYAYTIPFHGEARPQLIDLIFDDQEKITAHYPDLIRENDAFRTEVFCSALYHGKGAWVIAKASPLHDQSGNIMGAIESIRDISERKLVEETLRESEARYRSLFDDSPISLWEEDFSAVKLRLDTLRAQGVTDFNTYLRQHPEVVSECIALVQVLDVNRATLKLYGAGNKEILVNKLSNSLPEAGNEFFRDELTLMAAGANHFEMEMIAQTLSGKIITVTLNWVVIPGYENDLSKVIVSIIDISERKQAEAELLAAHATLEQRVVERTTELRTANRDLEKAARMKDEFLASMSHELRTPLTGILGLSEVLQLQTYGPLSEKQITALGHIHNSGQHLLELINDILDLSRIEAGKLDLDINTCSLAKICQSSLNMLASQAEAKHLSASFSIEPENILFNADARRLKQIMTNLLSNAIKFTPNGGSFGIQACVITQPENKSSKWVQITVWDTGIGIHEEDIPRLFQSFVQLDARLARQYNGTGLGLALVRKLAELHGGSVSAQSIFGQGSKFTVTLPWR